MARGGLSQPTPLGMARISSFTCGLIDSEFLEHKQAGGRTEVVVLIMSSNTHFASYNLSKQAVGKRSREDIYQSFDRHTYGDVRDKRAIFISLTRVLEWVFFLLRSRQSRKVRLVATSAFESVGPSLFFCSVKEARLTPLSTGPVPGSKNSLSLILAECGNTSIRSDGYCIWTRVQLCSVCGLNPSTGSTVLLLDGAVLQSTEPPVPLLRVNMLVG
ncbi:hypothetical protein BS17DRAFT_763952 [Gyrodon lividus]|nr:hypothetical protein BS17DRAFT_763952 [Gyrodon lividus]